MEKTKLQSRHRERWWQITSYIARSVELAENLWNRKLQLNTLVFLSMRDQSNSNRTVHNSLIKMTAGELKDFIQKSPIANRLSKLCSTQAQRAEKELRASTARPLDTNNSKSG